MIKYFTLLACLITSLAISKNLMAFTMSDALNSGLDNSKEYRIQKYYLKSAHNNKRSGITEFLPDISASHQTGKKQNIRSDGSGSSQFRAERTNTISVTQPIFNGMRGFSGLKQGSAEYLAQKFKLEAFKRDLILKIATNYLEVYRLERVLELTRVNAGYYGRILKSIKSRGKLTSENEIIDHKIGYHSSLRDLERIENELKQAKFEYESLVGVKARDIQDIDEEFVELNLEDLLMDKYSNPNVMQKRYEVAALRESYRKELGNLSPKVDVTASYSKQNNLVYLDGGNLESRSIFLNLKIPIFQKGVEYFGIKKARYDLKIKKEERMLTIQEVEKEINQVFQEYNYAKKSHDKVSVMFSLSRQKLMRNIKSYNLRALSLLDLLKIKIARNEAEIKFQEEKSTLHKAYYKLKLLTNGVPLSGNKIL